MSELILTGHETQIKKKKNVYINISVKPEKQRVRFEKIGVVIELDFQTSFSNVLDVYIIVRNRGNTKDCVPFLNSWPSVSCLSQNILILIWPATWRNRKIVTCAPSQDSDQPGHMPRVFASHMKKAWILCYPLSASEDSDQTGRMPRLIWVFPGHTVILLVLSWSGSYSFHLWHSQSMVIYMFYIHQMSQLRRTWHFSSSLKFLKRACTAMQWG